MIRHDVCLKSHYRSLLFHASVLSLQFPFVLRRRQK